MLSWMFSLGKNIRSSTETLTRRRIAVLNLAMLKLFIDGSNTVDDFVEQLPFIATEILTQRNTATADKLLANWLLGLTGKGFQNVLRSDPSLITQYRNIYINTCKEIIDSYRKEYGALQGIIGLNSADKIIINWTFMVYLLNAIGAQTLTLRGSEKSLYGKFFEKLVLGTLLHVLGFQHVSYKPGNSENLAQLNQVFWLSSQDRRDRESDATLLYSPGKGVRFDIGFIGSGNTEISLDKVSRYRREIELGSTHWYMGTIIIVDRIGPRSRIVELANEIDGTIIQMSAGYWPKRVALTLERILGCPNPFAFMEDTDIEKYLKEKIQEVPLMRFIHSASDTLDEEILSE